MFKPNQHCINLKSAVKSGILELGNKTENYYNYNGTEYPNTYWFGQIFIFFQNSQNQGQSTEGKEKRKERNDDKKKNQIRICTNCIQFIRLQIQK